MLSKLCCGFSFSRARMYHARRGGVQYVRLPSGPGCIFFAIVCISQSTAVRRADTRENWRGGRYNRTVTTWGGGQKEKERMRKENKNSKIRDRTVAKASGIGSHRAKRSAYGIASLHTYCSSSAKAKAAPDVAGGKTPTLYSSGRSLSLSGSTQH